VGLRGFSRWIFKLVEWATCRCSTVIQPDSASNLRFAIAEGLYRPGKGRVIWNGSATGVDLTRFDAARKAEWSGEVREQHGIPAQATVLGFVGSLRGDKGIAELYAACQLLFEAWPDLQILLVGDQEGYNTVPLHLRDWARTHPRVHHQPPVLDVEKYFAAMDLFVFPSYREGFGSVVIEAQALGLPVIVTDIAGPTDAMLAGSTGLVVPRADAGAVIEAVGALLGDPARMRAMGAKAREHIRLHFDQKELMPHFARDKEAMMAGPGANR
jgi:glycosyltransferase involved in cell wall biosynthesis